MKKEKFTGKLSLNKQMVAKLNNDQMGNIVGGYQLVSVNTVSCGGSLIAVNHTLADCWPDNPWETKGCPASLDWNGACAQSATC